MSKIPSLSSELRRDAYKWSLDTAAALRAGDFSRVDVEALINEIGSIATGLYLEMVTIITEIIESLLQLEYTDAPRDEAGQQLTRAQSELEVVLYSSDNLQYALPEAMEEAYSRAKAYVAEDYNIPLPDQCPIPLERIRAKHEVVP